MTQWHGRATQLGRAIPAIRLCYLLRSAATAKRDTLSVSLQTIATKTGLSKSTVQAAIRHLRRRRLLDPTVVATTNDPIRRVLRPWNR